MVAKANDMISLPFSDKAHPYTSMMEVSRTKKNGSNLYLLLIVATGVTLTASLCGYCIHLQSQVSTLHANLDWCVQELSAIKSRMHSERFASASSSSSTDTRDTDQYEPDTRLFSDDGEIDNRISDYGQIDNRLSDDGEIDNRLSDDGEIDNRLSDDGEIDHRLSDDGESLRIKRDVSEPETKKKRRRKNRNNFKVQAVHMYAMNHSQAIHDQVEAGGTPRVPCGIRQRNGLKVNCEKSTFWELDHHSQNSNLINLVNGVAVIQKKGLYLVYSQVTYHDVIGSWAFGIYRERHGSPGQEHSLMQCPGMEPHILRNRRNNKIYPVQFQCHTSRTVHFNKDDQVYMKNMYYQHGNRVVRLNRHLTFWGLIRLAE